MIILDTTTKSLQLKLAANVTTNALPFSVSYVDTNGTTTTPGENDGTSSTTTATVTMASSPASSVERLVKNITIQNADTASATVTIIYNNNSTLRNIIVATLAVGDQFIYEDGNGWSSVNSNGNLKTAAPTSVVGQLPGTTTNDNANAGNVGEYMSSTVSSFSVSLVTATAKTITSITLTPGDWDVSGVVGFRGAATTQLALTVAGISTTTNTMPGGPEALTQDYQGNFTNATVFLPVGPTRMSISSSTTVYIVGEAFFSVSTLTANGVIRARRVR